MNTIEHNQIEREEFSGFWSGEVVGVEDPKNARRVRVRVRGVFNKPVKVSDIPWARPLMETDIPELGSEVSVVFEKGDIERPLYFPSSFIGKERSDRIDQLYNKIVEDKKGRAVSDVSVVDSSFSEPETESAGKRNRFSDVRFYPEGVAELKGGDVSLGVPEKSVMFEVYKEKGKEVASLYHPSGTFVEVQKNGTVVIHGVAAVYGVTDGHRNEIVGGNSLLRVKGSLELKVDGGVKIKVDGDVDVESPNITLTGGNLKVDGSVTPTGSGPFCGITNCVFSGAPHVGNKVSGT